MENNEFPPSGRPEMPSHLARPPLIRRNAQNRVPLTVGARTQALQNSLEQSRQYLLGIMAQEGDRESQLPLEALQDDEVDEETLEAENTALAAEQRRYFEQYQANRVAEAARVPQGSQQFDAAASHARVQREYAVVEALPPHIRRTPLQAISWSFRHMDRESINQYLLLVELIPQASVASNSPSTINPETPQLDTPRPDTLQPVSGYSTEYTPLDQQSYFGPSAVNSPAPVQGGEEEEVGQGFGVVEFGARFAENGERVLAVDSETDTIAETSTVTSVEFTTSIADNTGVAALDDQYERIERMVDEILEDNSDAEVNGNVDGAVNIPICPYFGYYSPNCPY